MLIVLFVNLIVAYRFKLTGEVSLGSLLFSVISGLTNRSLDSFFKRLAVFGVTIVVTGGLCYLMKELKFF